MKVVQSKDFPPEQLVFFVSASVRKERLKFCGECEHIQPLPLISQKMCSACNCVVEFKTSLKASVCPKDKWHESTSNYQQEQP
jgi:hypothetical protein